MRLFIAIELPGDVRRHLLRVREELKPRIPKASFTRDENLHITLKFLGEVSDGKMAALSESLSLIRVAGSIEILANQIECFPSRGPVRIVAAGFDGSLDAMRALHQAIEQRCQHVGFDRETRAYTPHVTLARARTPLAPDTRELTLSELWPGPRCRVHEFTLVRSFLKPDGSQYLVQKRFTIDPNIY